MRFGYTANNWYWIAKDHNPGTEVFKTAASPPAFVANNDASYLTWLADVSTEAYGISFGFRMSVTLASDNGAGKTRLIVPSTENFTTGQRFYFGASNGNQQITVVGPPATPGTIDLLGLNFSAYVATDYFYGPTIIATAANLASVLGLSAFDSFITTATATSSSSNVTLTNPPPKVNDITLTGAATKVILPAMNTPISIPLGEPITVNNLADDRTIGVYAQDGTTLIANVDRGGSVSLSLKNNNTANGTFLINRDVNRLTQNFVTVSNADYTILNTDKVIGTSTTALTAERTWTLPAASEVNPAQPITIGDFGGAIDGVSVPQKQIKIIRAGADTINGRTAIWIPAKYGSYILWSNGSDRWTAEASLAVPVQNLQQVQGLIVANTGGATSTRVTFGATGYLLQDSSGQTTGIFQAASGTTGYAGIDISVAGPTTGGRDQAAAFSANTAIHLYAIGTQSGISGGIWSLSGPPGPPTLPTGITTWCYLTTVKTDGAGNLPTINITPHSMKLGGGFDATGTGDPKGYMNEMTAGQIPVGQTTSDPLPKTMSGDATLAASGALTVANDAVTNAKLADMAQSTIKGRASGAGTGDPTDLSIAQVIAILGVPANIRKFTSSSTYPTATNGDVKVLVMCKAGGGGGGGSTNGNIVGGSGGEGATSWKLTTASALSGQTVTVGGGGSNVAANTDTDGGAGGTSSIGSVVTANGGGGGSKGSNNGQGGVGGSGGTNDWGMPGCPGFQGTVSSAGVSTLMPGGGSGGGNVFASGTANSGGGGGGGSTVNASGPGGSGLIVCIEFGAI